MLFAGLVCGTLAFSQWHVPTKPVRLHIPYAAGGAVKILGRTVGDELSKRWGQPVIIENRTRAGRAIASSVVATLESDSYTLVISASGFAINPYLYAKLPYDTFKDFTPGCSEALNSPTVKQRIDNLGAAVIDTTLTEFDKYIRAGYQKRGPIIKAAGGSNCPDSLLLMKQRVPLMASCAGASAGRCVTYPREGKRV